jgi:hypothetical protein
MFIWASNMCGMVSRVACDNVKGGNPGWNHKTPCIPLSAPATQSPFLSEVWAPPIAHTYRLVHPCGSSKTWLLWLMGSRELFQDCGLFLGSPLCGPHIWFWCTHTEPQHHLWTQNIPNIAGVNFRWMYTQLNYTTWNWAPVYAHYWLEALCPLWVLHMYVCSNRFWMVIWRRFQLCNKLSDTHWCYWKTWKSVLNSHHML